MQFQISSIIIIIQMFETQREAYEYHFIILCVRMKVKFPSRMKIQNLGLLLTSQALPSEDSRFVFNQQVILRDDRRRQCFQLTCHLLTDKGAKYIAGVIKLYHSQMIRSQGEKLVLSLGKCIDNQAFCQIKVDQVVSMRGSNNGGFASRSRIQRNVSSQKMKDPVDAEFSPQKNNINPRIQQSRSEYQFPINQNFPPRRDSNNKNMYNPSQTSFQRGRTPSRHNMVEPMNSPDFDDEGRMSRQRMIEAQAYRDGYQKLKQKYKKQAETSKQEMNKRMTVQKNENNLKLQLMRVKMRSDQFQRQLIQRTAKNKQLQAIIGTLQQKQVQNNYLNNQLSKRDQSIRMLQDTIYSLNGDIDELRQITKGRNNEESIRIRQLKMQSETLRMKLQSKQRELDRQNKLRVDQVHEKQMQMISKMQFLEKQKRSIVQLQRNWQQKLYDLQKNLQNQKKYFQSKEENYSVNIQKLQKQIQKLGQERREQSKKIQECKNSIVKAEYQKKLLNQQYQSVKNEVVELRGIRNKVSQLTRQGKSIADERNQLEKLLQRHISQKQANIEQISSQFIEQIQYYKKVNKEFDQRIKILTTKLSDSDGQLEINRCQVQKLKKSLDAAVRQSNEAKEKQKNTRKAIKAKEHETLGFETQYATLKQKLKNIDQIYRLEADKIKQQSERLKSQLQKQTIKSKQMTEGYTIMSAESNRLKIQMQYADQKAEKDAANIKEKQMQIENMVKDYQEQISTLQNNVATLRQSEKQLSGKNQRYELQALRWQQKLEKGKKDIKIYEQRCSSQELTIKTRNSQIQALIAQKEDLESRIGQSENQLIQLRVQHQSANNENNKFTKIIQILQEEQRKFKTQLENNQLNLSERDKSIQQLMRQLKQEKDQCIKLQMKSSSYKKQIDRQKEQIVQNIGKCMNFITTFNSSPQIEKSPSDSNVKKGIQSTMFELITTTGALNKQVRQLVTRQSEQIKQTQRQNERLQQQISSSTNKNQNSEYIFKNQIEELQTQIEKILQQKESEINNFTAIINELNQKSREHEDMEQDLHTQIEELNFSISSMKMDFQSMGDLNNKKIANLRKINSQLQDKVQQQLVTITELDERCQAFQFDVEQLQKKIEEDEEQAIKKNKFVEELKQQNDELQVQIENIKKIKKQIGQKLTETELQLHAERENYQKTKQHLDDEQAKSKEMNNFVANLMKQKELSIKSEMQRSQSINILQNSLLQIQREFDLLKQEQQRTLKLLENQKQFGKQLTINMKIIQDEKREQKLKISKLQQKIRQKQKQCSTAQQTIKKIQFRGQKTVEKLKQQIKELQFQLQSNSTSHSELSKESNQKVSSLQAQLLKKNNLIVSLESQLCDIQEKLFMQKDKTVHLEEEIQSNKIQIQDLKCKVHELDGNLNQLNDQLREKQEKLFEYSGKNYSLELKIDSKQNQNKQNLLQIQEKWVNKFESMCQEYQQRIQMIQKQKSYLQITSDQRQRDISKLNNQLKTAQNTDNTTRRTYEEKIKKQEEQKLIFFTQKTIEMQKISDQCRTHAESVKAKQSELRRLNNQLETARRSIASLDLRTKQYDQKNRQLSKMYQNQIQQLKKKQISSKSFREAVSNHQWTSEREIKKILQNFVRNFLQKNDQKNSQKIIQLVRSVQSSILQITAIKLLEK